MAVLATPKGALGAVGDAALQRFVGYHLKLAFNVIRADLTEVLEPMGLRMITYSALALIVDNPGLRSSQLAVALSIERPNLVSIVDELEERGLVRRDRDASDRRAHALSPTPEGRRLCDQAMTANAAREAALLADVSADDLAACVRVLNRIKSTGRRAAA